MPGKTIPRELDPNDPDYLGAAESMTTPVTLVSGTGKQLDLELDRILFANTATAGSAVVALSPDGVTYTNVMTVTTRATDCLVVPVRKGWFVKVTLTTSTFSGTPSYY